MIEPRLLLVEISTGLGRRTQDVIAVREGLELVLANPRLVLVSMTDDLMDAATDIAAELRLRAGDAVYVALARSDRGTTCQVVDSWDREQLARSSPIVQASSPADDLQNDR